MATDSSTNSVAIVAIVILVLAALAGGYAMFGRGEAPAGRDNDIHIDLPDGKKAR